MTKRKYLHLTRRKRSKTINHILKKKKITIKKEYFLVSNGESISWLKIEVLKLQSQLAVVLREGNTDRTIRLIRKILRSNLTQQLAVYKTISSTGSKSKGISDKVLLKTRAEYSSLRTNLWEIIKNPNAYKVSPLKRIWVPKNNSDDIRPILVPSYLDRALQYLYLMVLEVFSEEFSDKNSFGFRPFRSPGWAAKALTLQISSRKSFGPPKYALELDISKCFDSISHDFIINLLTNYNFNNTNIEIIPPNIISQWLKCSYIDICGIKTPRNQSIPIVSAIPQEGPISPIIANMVFDGIESYIISKIKLEGSYNLCNITNKDRVSGYPLPKGMVRQLYSGAWVHKRDSWSYKIVNEHSSVSNNRNLRYDTYVSVIRYVDDIVILLNSILVANKVMDLIKDFLAIRGVNVTDCKTYLKNIYLEEKIKFVGYEFSIIKKQGLWKVYNYPPAEKVKNVKVKINKVFITYNLQPYNAFYLANAILRRWCKFYCTANSKNAFRNLHEWLFKRTYKYLTDFLRKNSKYRISSQRYVKHRLAYDLWNIFRFQHLHYASKWFGIPISLNPSGRWSVSDLKPYMLISPKSIKVSTPSIITGLSAFHPEDRMILNKKAIYWKPGLLKYLLIKSKGKCKSCGCDLLDPSNTIEIHYKNPLQFHENQKLTNLVVLCQECHKVVFIAVKTKNFDQIMLYEQSKILSNVSNILLVLTPQINHEETEVHRDVQHV